MLTKHRVPLSFALLLLGAPFRAEGGVAPWPVIIAVLLLALDTYRPVGYRPHEWLQRPRMGVISAAVFTLSASLFGSWSIGQVLWIAGAALFAWDVWAKKEHLVLKGTVDKLQERAQRNGPEEISLVEEKGAGDPRATTWAIALFVVGFLLGGAGDVPHAPLVGMLWIAAVVAVAADKWWRPWREKTPGWLHRPRLGTIATAIFVWMSIAVMSFTPLSWCVTAGSYIFARDAYRRGEIQRFDPRLIWHGRLRKGIFVSGMLAMMSLGAAWNNWYSSAGYYSHETSGNYRYTYWNPSVSVGGDLDASELAGSFPLLLLGISLVLLTWKGRGAASLWVRFAPFATGVALSIWAIGEWMENKTYAADVSGSGALAMEASGPVTFLFCSIPFCLMTGWLALKRAPKMDECPSAQAGEPVEV